MKKLVISVLLAVLFIFSSGVVNAEKNKPGGERSGRDRTSILRRARRDRSKNLRGQLQGIDEGIRNRQSKHKKYIDELISIKKLAIEEKAEKTAMRIEAMIQAKNAEFAESVKKLNETRDRFKEMMVPPGSKLPKEKILIKPQISPGVTTNRTDQEKQAEQDNKEDPKPEKEKKAKWWQFWK